MPWRNTTDPYKIWLSEIILQQTRVAQGLPYYLAFINTYPTVEDLAAASEEEVLKLWQGLGYYSRGRNLHFSAKYIVNELNGIFPNTYSDILKLKGVGDYTASAIASIAFNEPTAVVDGNVYRVLSRVFGIETPINSTEGIKQFKTLAQELIPQHRPADFNQAIMEFGAIQCKPQNPYCLHCIFNERCVAYQQNKITELPVKLKKIKIKKRYLNYLVIISPEKKTLLQQRTGKGIWQGLYEFPNIETEAIVNAKEESRFRESVTTTTPLDHTNVLHLQRYNTKAVVHKLSHQHLYTTFWIVKVDTMDSKGIPFDTIRDFPVPVLISNFIEEYFKTT